LNDLRQPLAQENDDSMHLGRISQKELLSKGKFWRLAAEGKKRAIVDVAPNLLVLVYHVLVTGRPYQERGTGIVEEQQKRRIRFHVRVLGRLSVDVGCRPIG
jgi:hypothetical protein